MIQPPVIDLYLAGCSRQGTRSYRGGEHVIRSRNEDMSIQMTRHSVDEHIHMLAVLVGPKSCIGSERWAN